uniref:FAD-binding protein n=1 Tax=Thalassobaculum salexigens TaxID=455360 RepID=UPI00248E304E
EMGGVRWADTPEGLADHMAVDGAALAQTVAAYNAAARGAAVDAFGRAKFELAPLAAPYAIVRVKPGLFHTQGGLMVDGDARVLRPDGSVVENLFAGGGAAAGISGRSGAGGYASGNGLLTALALGRLAGLRAAQDLRG